MPFKEHYTKGEPHEYSSPTCPECNRNLGFHQAGCEYFEVDSVSMLNVWTPHSVDQGPDREKISGSYLTAVNNAIVQFWGWLEGSNEGKFEAFLATQGRNATDQTA